MPRLKKVVHKPASPGPKWSDWIVPPVVHEKTWKSWTICAAETAAAARTTSTTTSFSTLPLELRNKIYFYAIDRVPCLTLVGSTTASEDETSHSANDELPVDLGLTTWLSSLATHLPNHLNLNKQYRAEALAELHHSALVLLTHLRVPRAVDFLRLLPNMRRNRNGNGCGSRNASASASATVLRIVDVTLTTRLSSSASSPPATSHSASTSSPTPCPTNQTDIHALSTLSPSLQSLTLSLSPAIMRDQNLYEPLLAPLVGANTALTRLRIEALGTRLEDAQRVERWVLDEGRKKKGEGGGGGGGGGGRGVRGGKVLRVVIDLAPGNDASWYEDTEMWTGGVRWVHSSDIFG